MKNIILYILLGCLLLGIGFINGSCCSNQKKTSLNNCISTAKETSFTIFGSKEKVKDSAFLRECIRYHREEIVDKYSMKKIYKKDKDGKYLRDKDGNLLFDLEPIKNLSDKEKMIFIETGHFLR